jgi:hypothetical protein
VRSLTEDYFSLEVFILSELWAALTITSDREKTTIRETIKEITTCSKPISKLNNITTLFHPKENTVADNQVSVFYFNLLNMLTIRFTNNRCIHKEK